MDIQPLAVSLRESGAVAGIDRPLAAPSAATATHFGRLMALEGSEPVPDVALAAPAPASLSVIQPASPGGPSLGDAILAGLRSASSDMRSKWSAVSRALDVPDLHMADMLRLQLTVSQMSVQYDLVGKAISRSTQNIDQLVKLQ